MEDQLISKKILELHQEINSLKQDRGFLTTRNCLLVDQIKDCIDKIVNLENEKFELKSRVKELSLENTKLQMIIVDLNNEIQKLKKTKGKSKNKTKIKE